MLWFTQTTIWFPWISKDISATHSFECLCCWTALAVMNCRTQALSSQTMPLIFMPQGNGWKEKSTDSSEAGKLECSPELTTSRDNMVVIDRVPLNTLPNVIICLLASAPKWYCKNSRLFFHCDYIHGAPCLARSRSRAKTRRLMLSFVSLCVIVISGGAKETKETKRKSGVFNKIIMI